ncbi:hypothetical protein J2R80_006634 [Bradyrhizobium sp. USDA 4541]|nr:hypothetical protein [Bradyrhizobium sp. USDA 4541]
MLAAFISFCIANPPFAGFMLAAIYTLCWAILAPFLYAPATPRRRSIRRRARRNRR